MVEKGHILLEQGHRLLEHGHSLFEQGHRLLEQGDSLLEQGHFRLIFTTLFFPESGKNVRTFETPQTQAIHHPIFARAW